MSRFGQPVGGSDSSNPSPDEDRRSRFVGSPEDFTIVSPGGVDHEAAHHGEGTGVTVRLADGTEATVSGLSWRSDEASLQDYLNARAAQVGLRSDQALAEDAAEQLGGKVVLGGEDSAQDDSTQGNDDDELEG
jgi:hypothetical protein